MNTRKNRPVSMVTITGAVMLMLVAAASALGAERRPNVIFILADDLGYGDISAFAGEPGATGRRIKTPNIDRLVREGVKLSSHYCAAPVCAPSRASLLTGRVQGRCSLRDNCFDRPFAETNTLGTVMRSAGFATYAVGKWGLAGGGESGLPVSSHPLDRGFDRFYGFLDHLAGHTYYHYRGRIRNAFMGITEDRADATDTAIGIYSTDLFTAKAKALVEAHVAASPSRPFFLYFAVNTVHGSGQSDGTLKHKATLHVPGREYPEGGVAWPLEPEPLEARNTWLDPEYRDLAESAARYATAVRRMDAALGDLVSDLKRLGIDRDTMIVFASDNGPADEYGADPRAFRSAGPFDGLKRDVFEGGMRVPAFVRWPARIAPGQTDDEPSQFHDWMATLADAAGAETPREACDGVTLLPRWRSPDGGRTSAARKRESLVYTEYEFPWQGSSAAFREFAARKGEVRGLQQMVRSGDYVALRTRMRDGGGKVRLYNVAEDPFETRDLSSSPEHSARLAALTAVLDERRRAD